MKELKTYNVCFIGRTGNGKTSLINKLFDTKFSTDPLVSCTKELFSVTKLISGHKEYEGITVFDTPGIGEYSSDSRYWRFYEDAISKADCIILVTTFDRTDAPVQRFLRSLKGCINTSKHVRFIVALNHIDSKIITDSIDQYEPWNVVTNEPSEQCLENVKEREVIIHQRFDGRLLPFEVVAVCAARGYNLDLLKKEIYNF